MATHEGTIPVAPWTACRWLRLLGHLLSPATAAAAYRALRKALVSFVYFLSLMKASFLPNSESVSTQRKQLQDTISPFNQACHKKSIRRTNPQSLPFPVFFHSAHLSWFLSSLSAILT